MWKGDIKKKMIISFELTCANPQKVFFYQAPETKTNWECCQFIQGFVKGEELCLNPYLVGWL